MSDGKLEIRMTINSCSNDTEVVKKSGEKKIDDPSAKEFLKTLFVCA